MQASDVIGAYRNFWIQKKQLDGDRKMQTAEHIDTEVYVRLW